jgi:hypothetical protein
MGPKSHLSVNVQSLLCRPLDYADHRLRTGSGGGDRCVGVGIIRADIGIISIRSRPTKPRSSTCFR